MYCLFSVISELKIERKKEYVLLFLENNPLYEDFKRIPLTPTSWSWVGSTVPMYSAWIETICNDPTFVISWIYLYTKDCKYQW